MLPFFVLLVSLLAAQSLAEKVYYDLEDAEHHFEEFITNFNKQYSNEEEKNFRFNIFKENLKKTNKNNVIHQAEFGITKFSDLTAEEFKRQYTGLRGFSLGACSPGKFSGNLSAPDSFDWRDKGAVTGVKNQGNCGSCWSFSVTGNIEGQYQIKHQNLLSLSEQQLVDCVTTNCFGCNGGMPEDALAFLAQNGGVMLESDYPYQVSQQTCQFDASKAAVKLTGCSGFSGHSEDDLTGILVNVGPLSIGIDASELSGYSGGIYDCTGAQIDHAVLLVGYGNDAGKPFWIVKNSWGTDWGEQGYFRMARGKNACGVTNMVNSGVVQ